MMKPVFAVLLLVLATVSGCAGMRMIDAEVQAVSTLAGSGLTLPGRYRFERLPLQTTPQVLPEVERVEGLAQLALAKVGMQRDDLGAQYSVQLGARMTAREQPRRTSPFGHPWWPGDWPGHAQIGISNGGASVGFGMVMPAPSLYQYELSLVIRDIASGKVMFESHANHEGPWSDSQAILPALFEAALKDFPNPSPSPRKINIELAR